MHVLLYQLAVPRGNKRQGQPRKITSRSTLRGGGFLLLSLLVGLLARDGWSQSALANGLAHDGTISAAGETDTWTIAANQGDRITVQIAELSGGAGFTPRIELFAPDGAMLGADSDGVAARRDVQAHVSGTFTAVVSDFNRTGTGTYRLRLAQVPGAFTVPVGDEGGSLVNGTNHQGTIDLGDLDLWTITANAGDRITVQIAELTGGAGFTPMIELFSPNGARLGVVSNTLAARLDIQAGASATYTVLVSDANQTGVGTYRLRLAQTPGAFVVPAGDEGGALVNGTNHSGTIDLGDLDLWTFTANEGDRFVLQLGELSGGASFTPRIELFAPDGTRVATNSNALVARLNHQAEFSGAYTVLISDSSPGGTGSYQLLLARVPASFVVPVGDEGGALADGVNTDGSIPVGDLDLWTFAAAPGDRITLQVTELTGGATFTPMIELFAPNGERLRTTNNATAATLVRAIEVGGTYTVLVSDASQTGTGTYRLLLTRGTITPPGVNVLTNGATHLGDVAVAGQTNTWTFTASAGDRIVLRAGELSATAFTPWIRLFNPGNTQIDSAFGASAAEIEVTAATNGTFRVIVNDGSGGGNQTGTYRLTLVKTGSPIVISPGDEGGPLTHGVMHTATIETGDIDAWTFTANAGENLVVRIGEITDISANFTPWIRLYGPDGAFLGDGFGALAGEVAVRATASGTFTVVVGDGNSIRSGVGTYLLTLAKTGSPIVISAGDEGGPLTNGLTHTASIETGDIDAWSFIANAGENLVVRIGEITDISANFTPWIRLYGPDGAFLDEGFGALAGEVAVRATSSGTFTVVAGDGNSIRSGSGTYRLSLAKTGSPIVISAGDEGGPLTNGLTHTASIETGDIDAWSFIANAGENLVVRIGEITDISANFLPWIRLYAPDGAFLGDGFGALAGEVAVRATSSGTFTVVAGDGNSIRSGAGTYRLTLVKTGSPILISAGDEGGPLTNGVMHTATIETGDIDAWTFTANAGENLVLRIGEITDISGSFTPWIRLYGPDGTELGDGFGALAGEVVVRATSSGTFTVVAGDGNSIRSGTGTYRLTLAKTGDPIVVSPGDESGALTGVGSYDGTIDIGDIDVWTFTVCAGESIFLRVDELVAGSGLTPWIRLYGRDGVLLNSVSGIATAQISRPAPAGGAYTVVIGDGTSTLVGSGAYRLTVNGLTAGMKMCVPGIAGTNAALSGVGGVSGEEFVVLTSPLVEAPLATWTPIFTNLFDFYGTFNRTSRFISTEPRRFYIIRQGSDVGPN
jgi:hypothetical protein